MHFISLSLKITTIIRVNMCVKLLNVDQYVYFYYGVACFQGISYINALECYSEYPGHDSLTQPGWWKLSQPGQANVSYKKCKENICQVSFN